ncbi:MAG: antibiotic biosynthesis monooxygenase, partial [Ornithinimicrobium sp.]
RTVTGQRSLFETGVLTWRGAAPDRWAYRDGCDHHVVTLEHALLPVRPGHEEDFEAAFRRAKEIIARMPGFRSLTLSRCLEQASTYLLLVEWDSLEDHTVGFRSSQDYQEWRQLLHHFYEPFPVVEHYEQVLTA